MVMLHIYHRHLLRYILELSLVYKLEALLPTAMQALELYYGMSKGYRYAISCL